MLNRFLLKTRRREPRSRQHLLNSLGYFGEGNTRTTDKLGQKSGMGCEVCHASENVTYECRSARRFCTRNKPIYRKINSLRTAGSYPTCSKRLLQQSRTELLTSSRAFGCGGGVYRFMPVGGSQNRIPFHFL